MPEPSAASIHSKTASTFAISVGVVAIYYGILAVWFWNLIPTQLANG